ncbi:hypothetical protein JW933_04090 [candidate division FCPU426 bacterium]|nr:hypothetical protein [candidate division FCPU426 bacterium]
MNIDPQPAALTLLVVGAFFSLSREYLAKWYVRIYGWLRKQKTDMRLEKGVQVYFMLTGMFFTVLGILGWLGILPLGE